MAESNSAVLDGNTFISNTADYWGGGLFIGDSNATLINNIVAANRVNSFGGSGLLLLRSSAQLLHTTFARNQGGDGSGIYIAASDLEMTNSILVSHTVGISVANGCTVTLESTLWGSGAWANFTDWDGAGNIITGVHNYQGDPAFVNPTHGDYHIGPGSAAIDKGVDAGVTTDIDGDPRPSGPAPDLGADENVIILGHRSYLPLIVRNS